MVLVALSLLLVYRKYDNNRISSFRIRTSRGHRKFSKDQAAAGQVNYTSCQPTE